MAEPLSALTTELDTDPLTRGYSSMSDQAAADDLNTTYRTGSRIATASDARSYLMTQINGTGANQRSVLGMIEEYAASGTVRGASAGETAPAARQSGAKMIWFMLQHAGLEEGFDVTDANVVAQFTALGPDGGDGPSVLTGVQLSAIGALADRSISRAEELGISMVDAALVRWARLAI